jgi:tRNA threonylcarbamoyl adenosine modification protein YeaZ
MKMLAFEFSTSRRTVAACEGGRVLGEVFEEGRTTGQPVHLVEGALAAAKWEREVVDCLVVGLGPGSYTGMRIGIALAQGWQLAQNVRILGAGTFDAMAFGSYQAGRRGLINIAVDAQRGEYFLARYQLDILPAVVVEPMHLAQPSEIEARLRAAECVMGPDLASRWSGAVDLFPRAAWLGLLATGRTDFVPGERLEPIYLRETNYAKAPPLNPHL